MTHQQALDTMAAERYLLDEMTEIEKHAFEEHYFDCDDCAQEVRLGEQIRAEVRAARGSGLEAQDSHARTSNVVEFNKRPVWRRASTVIPWAAAAMLALTAGYQSLVVVPGLRQAIEPQSLSPVMLREATRGTLPVVTVAPGQRFVTLGIDVMTASTHEMSHMTFSTRRATRYYLGGRHSPLQALRSICCFRQMSLFVQDVTR